uniref:Uncharacterized protein n=1 Tax=Avena sativa TaxID=4498 RepID=A0ACD5UVN4_AVESA
MTMAAEEEEPSRPFPFLVVSDILYNIRLVDNPQDWAKVKCLRREAYGCEERGDLIVGGLTLYVRAGPENDPHLHPSLCIGATHDVLNLVGSEIDNDMAECYGRAIRLSGRIYTVAGDVIVLRVSFHASQTRVLRLQDLLPRLRLHCCGALLAPPRLRPTLHHLPSQGQGVMHCDQSKLINNKGHLMVRPLGKFKYLPSSCRTREDIEDPPLTVYRNMGRVGNSIWFVMIKPSKMSPGETIVGVWTLDLSSEGEGEWEVLSEFKMRSIWQLDGFRDKKLPLTVPKYPILRQQDDGILYMLLPEPSTGGGSYAHLVGIHFGHGQKRLVMNRRLSIPWM